MRLEADERESALKLHYEEQLHEKDCIIAELQNRLAHAEALLGHDGTNTGLPTSQTPPGKRKHIPNARVKTGRKKGGQPGHEKHMLEAPPEWEVTEVVPHGGEGLECPECGGTDYFPTGESECRYEYDVEVVVHKRKHVFYYYECGDCGTVFALKTPPGLRGAVQYGSGLQAMALSMTNTANAAMNKAAAFLHGITAGELSPCDGYIAKLQERAAGGLLQFREDLKLFLATQRILYWDDTVVTILTARSCFRFYGNEKIACYTAHAKKDMEGIDEDGVLALLTRDNIVMHDHATLNYNRKFSYANIECVQHLERDLQKNSDDTQHAWSLDVKGMIGRAIKERKELLGAGAGSFDDAYVAEFHRELDEKLAEGRGENEANKKAYGIKEENALLNRIEKYRRNYFRWLEDFSLPTTNNLSERSLRGIKSHMKISGQFESVKAADNHALIRTYTETCRRNGINEIIALKRLCEGNPYTVQEIFSKPPP